MYCLPECVTCTDCSIGDSYDLMACMAHQGVKHPRRGGAFIVLQLHLEFPVFLPGKQYHTLFIHYKNHSSLSSLLSYYFLKFKKIHIIFHKLQNKIHPENFIKKELSNLENSSLSSSHIHLYVLFSNNALDNIFNISSL